MIIFPQNSYCPRGSVNGAPTPAVPCPTGAKCGYGCAAAASCVRASLYSPSAPCPAG